MAKSVQLKTAIWFYLLLTWGVVAYAAETNTFAAGIEAIPLNAVLYVLALSVVGGAAGTLNKIARPDIVVRNLAVEIVKDLVCSIVAGLIAFFVSSWYTGINFWLQAALITLAGYGGSKVIERVYALSEQQLQQKYAPPPAAPPVNPSVQEETPP